MPAEFDSIAHVYDDSMAPHINAHYAHKRVAFVRAIGGHGPVLDVGCGTGRLANDFKQAGYAVYGLDLSVGMLGVMRREHGILGSCGNSYQLPFADGSFGVVICVAVLHHVVDPEPVAHTIREMVRVTRPGGRTVIWDHNPNNPYWPHLMARLPQDAGRTRLVPAREILAAVPTGQPARLRRLGWTPEFTPRALMPAMVVLERVLEALPGVNALSAHNVVVVEKR
jgi:ubiquinone/menaquinone biosynthesis C-methylase UbiE